MNTMPLTSLLWFAAIIVMIPLALWLLKRTPLGGAASGDVMRSIAALPLSTSQRILTVEVGHGDQRRWLVLGVTPNSITTLHTMEPPAEAPGAIVRPHSGQAGSFANVLQRLRSGASGTDRAP
ncbi:MAG: flagellar biosynthetic protein FliO [Burkholderiaceae bacterium]|nr:flagellar biosynthetic protein FliO [Burkholderiaceae bacterium]